jgi:TatD DNase family protein
VYYDAHCHYVNLKKKYEGFVIASVSMDYRSSLANLELKDENVLKGIGIHPWNVGKEKLEEVLPLVKRADFLGEIGLDYRLSSAPRELQVKYFEAFLEEGQGKTVNVHALDAWADSLKLLLDHDVERAILHWYSGPTDLLKDIEGAGYFVTINPSVTFQAKHRAVLERAPPEIILTESDGGYEYKGKLLEPTDVIPTLEYIAKVKEMELEEVKKKVEENFKKAFKL